MSLNNVTIINVTSSTSTDLMIVISFLSKNIVYYFPILFLILGFIGFIGNALTFLHHTLRFNTFCLYALCGSFVDIIYLSLNIIMSYFTATLKIQYSQINSPLVCKFLCHSLVFLPQLSINYSVLSLIDRFGCTCSLTSPIRRINKLNMAPWWIGLTFIISYLIPIHALIINDVIVGRGCAATQPLLYGILSILISGLMQPSVMSIFVFLTYRNIQLSRQRVGAAITTNPDRRRNKFVNMILGQIVATACLALPSVVLYALSLIMPYSTRNAEQNAIFYFVYSLSYQFYYLNNVKSFFLATLASSLFRKTFVRSLKELFPRFLHPERQNMSLNGTRSINRGPKS